MPKYLCDDGNAEIEIEASTAREAAQEYVDGGDWGEIENTLWISVYLQEVSDCDHGNMTGSTCNDCGEVCSFPEDDICSDDECPIHGNQHVGERERVKITLDPDEPKCNSDKHDWQSPHNLVGGLKENPGVLANGGGVIIREVCMRCGCERTTNTWAQDRADGEQGLVSVSYEKDKYDVG